MANIQTKFGARTALTTTALNSLANATYVLAGTIARSSDNTNDIAVEVTATPGTVSGNLRLVVFAKVLIDGTNFSSGPESGTTTTDEPDLYMLGLLPLATSAGAQTKTFSVVSALGWIPNSVKIIVKNDSGAALAASGNSVYYSEISNPVI